MNNTFKFKNKKVADLIKRKEQIAKEINEMSEKWRKEDQKAKKMAMEMDRIKDKINPIIADAVKEGYDLQEFDVVSTAKYEGDTVVVNILNMVELYKEQLRKKNVEEKTEDKKE